MSEGPAAFIPHHDFSLSEVSSACHQGLAATAVYQRSLDMVVTVKFIIGAKNLSRWTHYEVINESELYHDIIFLDDLVDSYSNLSRKVLRSLTLAYEETDFHFLVKLDDDSLVQVNKMHGDSSSPDGLPQ